MSADDAQQPRPICDRTEVFSKPSSQWTRTPEIEALAEAVAAEGFDGPYATWFATAADDLGLATDTLDGIQRRRERNDAPELRFQRILKQGLVHDVEAFPTDSQRHVLKRFASPDLDNTLGAEAEMVEGLRCAFDDRVTATDPVFFNVTASDYQFGSDVVRIDYGVSSSRRADAKGKNEHSSDILVMTREGPRFEEVARNGAAVGSKLRRGSSGAPAGTEPRGGGEKPRARLLDGERGR